MNQNTFLKVFLFVKVKPPTPTPPKKTYFIWVLM